jgi:membrane dipeptidase
MPGVTPDEFSMDDSIVWDNHACFPLRSSGDHLRELNRYRLSGVNVVSLNIGFADHSLDDHLKVLCFMRRWIKQNSTHFSLAQTTEDILDCKLKGKLAVIFDIEGMCPVLNSLQSVELFYELGVKWMLVAYNRNNGAGGGCLDNDCGLTDLGRQIIDEMERIGMVVCVSHTGAKTAHQVLEYAKKPVIFSHSNANSITPHPRNISDDLIKKCADTGGVIGLNGFGPFLGEGAGIFDSLEKHLKHVIDLVGPYHVGLGLDYVTDKQELIDLKSNDPSLFPFEADGNSCPNMLGPEAMGQIIDVLTRFNLSDAEIHGIVGGNWLRVATQVWR